MGGGSRLVHVLLLGLKLKTYFPISWASTFLGRRKRTKDLE